MIVSLLLGFSALSLLLVFCIYIAANKKAAPEQTLEQFLQELRLERKAILDKELNSFLLMLELPQLAEQKKREEVANQLDIVLTAKLLLLQAHDCSQYK